MREEQVCERQSEVASLGILHKLPTCEEVKEHPCEVFCEFIRYDTLLCTAFFLSFSICNEGCVGLYFVMAIYFFHIPCEANWVLGAIHSAGEGETLGNSWIGNLGHLHTGSVLGGSDREGLRAGLFLTFLRFLLSRVYFDDGKEVWMAMP